MDFGDSRFGLDQSKLIKNANATSIIVIRYLLVCFKVLHDSIRQIENNILSGTKIQCKFHGQKVSIHENTVNKSIFHKE